MKLMVISGTPKTFGITHSLAKTAMATARECGIDGTLINLSELELDKCHMCDDGWGICFKDHICAFGKKDGFNQLQEKVAQADAYVYITPVYWGEISEGMKNFLDRLRRCQATKRWDKDKSVKSCLIDKPSILVANAGGGGAGTLNALKQLERAVEQMSGDEQPRERVGIFDYISVNRWNQEYKREALKQAIKEMVSYFNDKEKRPPEQIINSKWSDVSSP